MASKLINHPGPFSADDLARMRLEQQHALDRRRYELMALQRRHADVTAQLATAIEVPARTGLAVSLRAITAEIQAVKGHYADHLEAIADIDTRPGPFTPWHEAQMQAEQAFAARLALPAHQ